MFDLLTGGDVVSFGGCSVISCSIVEVDGDAVVLSELLWCGGWDVIGLLPVRAYITLLSRLAVCCCCCCCCRPSYGDTELGYFNKFGSWEYIIRMNVELAKMAARGLTVMAGSGDAGTS